MAHLSKCVAFSCRIKDLDVRISSFDTVSGVSLHSFQMKEICLFTVSSSEQIPYKRDFLLALDPDL